MPLNWGPLTLRLFRFPESLVVSSPAFFGGVPWSCGQGRQGIAFATGALGVQLRRVVAKLPEASGPPSLSASPLAFATEDSQVPLSKICFDI